MAITNAQQFKQLVNPPMEGKKRPGYRGDDAYGGGVTAGGSRADSPGDRGDGKAPDVDMSHFGDTGDVVQQDFTPYGDRPDTITSFVDNLNASRKGPRGVLNTVLSVLVPGFGLANIANIANQTAQARDLMGFVDQPKDEDDDQGPGGSDKPLEGLPILTEGIVPSTPDKSDVEDINPFRTGPAYRFMNKGGIADTVVGGEFDFESARQMYGLGKLVKKITKSVKKVAKSDLGKAALLYAGTAGLGAFGAGSAGTGFKLFGSKSFLAPSNVFSNFVTSGKNLGLLKRAIGVGKDGTIYKSRIGPLSKLGIGSGILGASALAGLMTPEEEEEDENFAEYRGEGLDIDAIRANPYAYIPRRFAAEGGDIEKEPVAKKTMPLLDMGGKEMDLRAEGGFVPIGRMEKADDVPARLSKNEFVFTADAVRNAGDGNVDKGAEVMYNMMKNLEAGGEVSEESQGMEGARKMFQTSQRLEEVL